MLKDEKDNTCFLRSLFHLTFSQKFSQKLIILQTPMFSINGIHHKKHSAFFAKIFETNVRLIDLFLLPKPFYFVAVNFA